jgi:hypothetical protein
MQTQFGRTQRPKQSISYDLGMNHFSHIVSITKFLPPITKLLKFFPNYTTRADDHHEHTEGLQYLISLDHKSASSSCLSPGWSLSGDASAVLQPTTLPRTPVRTIIPMVSTRLPYHYLRSRVSIHSSRDFHHCKT